MHFHLPKPLHGWRALAGEVGIIVLGVLIALGAEQAVETQHWRSEARDFRKAVDHELSVDLATYEFNQLQQPCIKRRLDELQAYLDRSRSGATVDLSGKIGMPLPIDTYTSVWDNKDAQVVDHLPVDVRLKYASLYDEFRTTEGIKQAQTAVWKKLVPFEEAGPLTLEDRRQLHSLIEDARGLSSALDGNWPYARKEGAELGLQPDYPPDWPDFKKMIPSFDICKPILKTGRS
jgi:hypothetical protein